MPSRPNGSWPGYCLGPFDRGRVGWLRCGLNPADQQARREFEDTAWLEGERSSASSYWFEIPGRPAHP